VIEHYQQSDPIATGLMKELVLHAESFLQMLFQNKPKRVSLVGGLAQFVEPLLSEKTQAQLSKPLADALSGSFLLINNLGQQPND
jgi:glucosamine kinase